jgi:hypothetical protein
MVLRRDGTAGRGTSTCGWVQRALEAMEHSTPCSGCLARRKANRPAAVHRWCPLAHARSGHVRLARPACLRAGAGDVGPREPQRKRLDPPRARAAGCRRLSSARAPLRRRGRGAAPRQGSKRESTVPRTLDGREVTQIDVRARQQDQGSTGATWARTWQAVLAVVVAAEAGSDRPRPAPRATELPPPTWETIQLGSRTSRPITNQARARAPPATANGAVEPVPPLQARARIPRTADSASLDAQAPDFALRRIQHPSTT